MFKVLIICAVALGVAVAAPLGACGGFDVDQAKEVFKDLSDAQQAEIKAVFAEALAPGSNMTKAQAMAQLEPIWDSLSPEQQARIGELIPTDLPDVVSNLSPEAQQVVNEVRTIVQNQDRTIAQDREEIKAIFKNASPAVQAELKAVKGSCLNPQ